MATQRYISMAPFATALYLHRFPELSGPLAQVCSLFGEFFPDAIIGITAVWSVPAQGMQLVLGISAPLNEESAEVGMEIMERYFQPVMDRIGSPLTVLIGMGDNLGIHSRQPAFKTGWELLAYLDRVLVNAWRRPGLPRLRATSIPLYERGHEDDLQRAYRVANRAHRAETQE